MVIRSIFITALIATAGVVQAESAAPLTGNTLKQRLQGNYSATLSAAERLKASRGDTDSLRVLSKEDIQYRLPNGSYVIGMLLPNGKVTPALRDGDHLMPACVTTDYILVPGQLDGSIVRCELEQSDLAILTAKDTVQQVGLNADGEVTQDAQQHTGGEPENAGFRPSRKYASGGSTSEGVEVVTPPIQHEARPGGDARVYAIDDDASRARPVSAGNIYVPPIRNNSKAKTVAGVLSRDPNKFGVPIGTWVKAELLRPVSSAESGLIEFVLTEDLVGKFRTMPAGTTIFAEKAINEAEKRLESLSQIASLPDGTEIKNVSMRAFALDKTAGIAGTLIRDRDGEFSAIGGNAALSTLSALVPAVEGPAGAAVDSVTDGVIGNEKKYAPKTPNAVIRVTPQPLLLKVARTF